MAGSKTENTLPGIRGEPLRQRVIDAAERLLREGKTDFSMRDLAAEAGVSFATPFNQFGSKAAIVQALSTRRIDTMEARFAKAPPLHDTADRVLLAIDAAVAVMLEEPEINRAVMGWLGTASPLPGQVWARSMAFWTLALGTGEGLIAARREQALSCLPTQDSPHSYTAPNISAKTGWLSSISENRSTSGSRRCSGMVGINS
jgi:AcrR family transcriptional regulator